MLKRINMLSVSIVLTVLVFILTTSIQKMFVKYEPTVKVLVAAQDIPVSKPLDKLMFKQSSVPISLIMNLKVIKTFGEIEKRYSTENIHKGEILRGESIALKNALKIIEIEPGREKISVKVKYPENAVSYQIKTGDKVNLYFTGKTELVNGLAVKKEVIPPLSQTFQNDGYSTVRLLEDTPVLGIFDETGASLSDITRDSKIDTVVFSVAHADSMLINNLKAQGTFDITGLPY